MLRLRYRSSVIRHLRSVEVTMKAFISRKLPDVALDIVRAVAETEIWTSDSAPPRELLLDRCSRIDGLLCLLTEKIDEELLGRSPNLRVVSQMAVGFDNIDVPACTAHGVAVGNTPG